MAVVSRIATLTLSRTGSTRTWRAEAVTQDTAAGVSVTINFTQTSSGATPPGTANNTRELILKDDSGATITTFTWTEGAASATFTYHFTADGTSGTAARSGTVGMTLKVIKTNGGPTETYDVESDGSPSTTPAGMTVSAADVGWIRGTTTATVSVNKTSLGSAAFTGTYAYPDSLFMRTTLGAQAYVPARTITNAVGAVLTNATAGSGSNYDSTFSQAVDARFSVGSHSATVSAVANATLTGQPWTALTTTPQSLTVDSRVTLANLTSDSGGLAKVYNRAETATGNLDVTNARGEAFTPRGTATLTSVDTGGGVENSITFVRTAADYDWSSTFATSGNVAPATDAGSAKLIRWRDSASNSPTPADTATYGLLSSKLNLAVHLQERQTALDPNLNTTGRNASVIGYYGFKVTNVRGEAYNGAQGKISLRPDDDSLPEVVSATLTSATINTHAGYTPLQSWSDPLPDGGWDVWASTSFTKDGNTGAKARSGTGVYDVSLIAQNPDYVVFCQVGSSEPASHNVAGYNFEIEAKLIDSRDRKLLAVDTDGGGMPEAYVVLRRIAGGVAQYLDTNGVWQSAHSASDVAAAADSHRLVKAAGQFLYALTFNDTDDWTNDISVTVRLERNGSPYVSSINREIVGNAHSHGLSPAIQVFAGSTGGNATSGGHTVMPNPDGYFVVTAQLLDGISGVGIAPDLDGSSNPEAYCAIFHTGDGAAGADPGTHYLDSDGTFKSVENAGPAHYFQMEPSTLTTGRVFLSFPEIPGVPQGTVAPDTSNFRSDKGLSIVVKMTVNSKVYATNSRVDVVGGSNSHGGYALDAIDLALNGSLSQR